MRSWLCGVLTNHVPRNSAERLTFKSYCQRCGRVFGVWANDQRKAMEDGYRAGRTCSYPVPMDSELGIKPEQLMGGRWFTTQNPDPAKEGGVLGSWVIESTH